MKRLILTIILGMLIIIFSGCVGYRYHHHWHNRGVVVVTSPKYPPLPQAYPPHPHRHHAPPPVPGRHHRF